MSTDQPTLDAFAVEEPDETVDATAEAEVESDDGEGARYRWTPSAEYEATAESHTCRNCGAAVPPRVSRVVGDNNHCVPACKDCADDLFEMASRGTNIERTVAAVREFRQRQTAPTPGDGGINR